MKKLIVVLLLALMLLSLVACGGEETAPQTQGETSADSEALQTQPSESEPPTDSEAPTEELLTTQAPTDPEAPIDEPATTEEPVETQAPADPGGEDAVTILETDAYLIRVIGVNPHGTLDTYRMNLYIENKSDSKTFNFIEGGVAVNGIQQDASFHCSVAPASAINSELMFYQVYGPELTEITDIEIHINIYEEGHSSDQTRTVCHYYPKGKDKAGGSVLRTRQNSDVRLVDTGLLTFISIGRHTDGYYLYPDFYLYNKSNTAIRVCLKDFTVNGANCGDFNYTIYPGKTMYCSPLLTSQSLGDAAKTPDDIAAISTDLVVYEYSLELDLPLYETELLREHLEFQPAK